MAGKVNIVVSAVDKASKPFKSITSRFNIMNEEIVRASRQMGLAMAGAATAVGALGLGMIKAAAGYEQSEVAFTTMLGSAEKAKIFMEDLTNFAKRTPFELRGLEESSKKLLAYGIEQEKVLPSLESLGNIAAGVGMEKLPQLILAFGQVKAATKLTGMELRQFTEAGVPLLDALSKSMGKTVPVIQKMVSAGEIGFAQVENAMRSLSSEGGKFSDLMTKQSTTLAGKWSNLADAWDIFLRNEGKALLEWGKQLVDMLIGMVNNALPKMITAIKSATKWLGEHKIVLVAIAGFITGILIPAIVSAATAMVTAFVATGPVGLAFAALAAAIYLIVENIDAIAKPINLLIEDTKTLLRWLNLIPESLEETAVTLPILTKSVQSYTGVVREGDKITKEFSGTLNKMSIEAAAAGAVLGSLDDIEVGSSSLPTLTKNVQTFTTSVRKGDEMMQTFAGAIDEFSDLTMVGADVDLVDIVVPVKKAAKEIKDSFDDSMEGSYEAVKDFTLKGAENLTAFRLSMVSGSAMAHVAMTKDMENLTQQVIEDTYRMRDEMENMWGGFVSTAEGVQVTMTDMWVSFRQGMGDAVAASIMEGQSLAVAFTNLMKSLASALISALIQMGIERIALSIVYGTSNLQEITARMASQSAATYAAAYAATVGIPGIGIAIAPGVAAAAVASMLAGATAASATGAATGAAIGGALGGGLDNVPAESTYLLHAGERVLSPRQNKELTDYLHGGGGGGGVVVKELNVMPNSTIDKALFDKPVSWWSSLVREKVLPAMNILGRSGHRTSMAYDLAAAD